MKKKKLKKVLTKEEIFKDINKEQAVNVANMIIVFAKNGYTLNMVLLELDIKQSVWKKAYKKYKVLQEAVNEAVLFRRAYGEKLLMDMAREKKTANAPLTKLLMESFYDIKEGAEDTNAQVNQKKKLKFETVYTNEDIEEVNRMLNPIEEGVDENGNSEK